jgi:hypothetical protein
LNWVYGASAFSLQWSSVLLPHFKRFRGQTWNYRKNGEPFMMNWYCYAIYGERGEPIYYVAEQEDATEVETLRMKQQLMTNPHDPEAEKFFAVLDEYKSSLKRDG